MMKKRLVWATLLALVSTSVPSPAWADDDENDADVPPFAKGLIEKNDYRALRDDYLSLVRGVPHFLPYEPRSRAIRDLERAERETPSIDPAFWTEVGPAPIPNGQIGVGAPLPVSGRTISIAVHPTNPDIVYVGTAQGGIYRSTNGGTNWTPIFDSALSLAIGALALAPSNPEILYVGTGEPNGSADSFFGVGLYRIDNASTTANLTGPINPLVTTGLAGIDGVHRPRDQRDPGAPDRPGDHLRLDHRGHRRQPVERRRRLHRSAAGHARRLPLDQRHLGDARRSPSSRSRPACTVPPDTTGNIAVTDMAMDPLNPNRIVAWANGAAAANNGGIYLSTNALAPTPTFTQTLVTGAPATSAASSPGNNVAGTVTVLRGDRRDRGTRAGCAGRPTAAPPGRLP